MENKQAVKMPKLGESIVSATIVSWLKKPGDFVQLDEPLLEVSTDKVNSEIPSPFEGKLVEIVAQEGVEYDVDATLCYIASEREPTNSIEQKQITPAMHETNQEQNDFYSPAVLRIAKENQLSYETLDQIPRSGSGNRLTKQDVENYCSQKKQENIPTQAEGGITRIQMNDRRKAIAANMVKSFYQAPHATLVHEVDVTQIMHFIQANKATFLQKYGYKLTITSFIAQAIASSLASFSYLNASVEEDTIVVKEFIHLGIAVSVNQSILVPVIKDCHKKCLLSIAKEIAQLSEKAHHNQLKPEDVSQGTITMTNFGMSGTKIGIPIIRYPEVAIIGVGAIEKKPVALDDSTMAIRSRVNLSLTFDHRVIDGMYGCSFLATLQERLENPDLSSLSL